jgi:hypothetical protein
MTAYWTRDFGTQVPIIKVVTWYADKSCIKTVTPEEWGTLPSIGIQLVKIVYRRHDGHTFVQDVIYSRDYYWHLNGRYYCTTGSQIPEEAQYIKTGSLISDEDFTEIFNLAQQRIPV